MKNRLLQTLLLLLITTFLSYATYAIQPFNGTFAEVIEKAKKENKDIFIEFTASWSEPCKEFQDKILTRNEVIKVIENNYIYLSIDVNVQKYANIIKIYGTGRGVPVYTIINHKGEIINKIDGAILKKKIFLASLARRKSKKISPESEDFDKLMTESISYNNEKPVFRSKAIYYGPLFHRIHISRWKIGTSVGIKFSQMSEVLTSKTTGYNVDLFMYRHINKFTFQPGINFSSSGGKNSEIKLRSHNIQIPLSFGIDLFEAAIVTGAQPIKLFITPYAQYTMKTNLPNQFKRWDVGTKASINFELGAYDLSVYYDMGFIDQSKIANQDIFNRSCGVNISMFFWR